MTIACPDCGTIQDVLPLAPDGIAICRSCEDRLERSAGRNLDAALACAGATFILLFPANLLPFLGVSFAGVSRVSLLGSGVVVLWDQQWLLLALLIAAFAIVLPFARFGLLAVALAAIRLGQRPPWVGPVFRWATLLDLWAMPDVFLIGCAIGYSRVAAYVPVRIGAGGWCFLAAAFLSMITDASLDRRSVWRAIAAERPAPRAGPALSCISCDLLLPLSAEGGRCPRCGARLMARKPDAPVRTVALVAAGCVLYGPANFYPMSNLLSFGGVRSTRIYDGVEQLIHAHLWPLAILIFTTSIAIPFVKLAALSWFVVSIRRRARWALVSRTKLHRFVDRIGRWSNIDVFTIAVFAPLMQFGQVAVVQAGWGATSFVLVVVLTMLASRWFDPRLMWDAAEGRI